MCVFNIICIVKLHSWTVSPEALGDTERESLISSLEGLRDADAPMSQIRPSLDGDEASQDHSKHRQGSDLPLAVVTWANFPLNPIDGSLNTIYMTASYTVIT